jgi:hypothetical protein
MGVLAAAVWTLGATDVFAATYIESVCSAPAGTGGCNYVPSTTGQLNDGINTFTGTFEFGLNGFISEQFLFAGTLNSISISYDSITFKDILISQGGSFLASDHSESFFANDGPPELINNGMATPTPLVILYNPTLFPFRTGFEFVVGSVGFTPTSPQADAVVNYTITLDLTDPLPPPGTVPLPAALPLFATGIGGLGFLGWRRKRKAQATA